MNRRDQDLAWPFKCPFFYYAGSALGIAGIAFYVLFIEGHDDEQDGAR